MKTKTIIVYEEVPESTHIFLVDGDRRDLDGKFINMVDCELTEKQREELTDPEKHFGAKIPMPLTLMTDIVHVVVCGFLL